MGENSKTWIVIPALNEGKIIEETVRQVAQVYPHVVVIDDGSSDRTAEAALKAGATVLRHCINLGQGAAIKSGITYSLLRGADLIVTFDADGQHRVKDIGVLIQAMRKNGAEVVVGSRFLGMAPGIPRARRIMLKMAVAFMRWKSGVRLTDAHNGLRLFTARAAGLIKISQNRMAHASEIVEEIGRLGLTVAEAPVTTVYTAYSLRKGQRLLSSLDVLFEMLLGRLQR